ncbi:phage virion morphogenesis protein [Pectobacterium aroidearum]|nr:phage virion morphogenesis protein [Pectobacterium aroidearum]
MQYPQRQLLGFSTNDKQLIIELIIQHLNRYISCSSLTTTPIRGSTKVA